MGSAQTEYKNSETVANAGVMVALPALIANGVFDKIKQLYTPKGGYYYRIDQIILILCYLTLARVKCFYQIQNESVGEWGRVLGLDRIPVAKTMYGRINDICANEDEVGNWCETLSKNWCEIENSREVATYYCDGRQNIYYGSKHKPPRRYISRQRLCHRGQTEWWINDHAGEPILMVSTPLTDGLISVLENEIIPNMIKNNRDDFPTQKQLDADSYICLFKIIVDREGYSPNFFKRMWEEYRIAVQTYHKYPGEDWAETEFSKQEIIRNSGVQEVLLAERGTKLSNGMWVREVRKLNSCGHQTSVISTDFKQDYTIIAADMFDRWSQENFFKYGAVNLFLDHNMSHELEDIDPEKIITNPAYSRMTSKIRSLTSKINRRKINIVNIEIDETLAPKKVERSLQRLKENSEELELFEQEKQEIYTQRKSTSKKIIFKKLPEEEQFKKAHQAKTQFINMIRIIAYRAETALVDIFKASDRFSRDARNLIQDLFKQSADFEIDTEKKVIHVKVHHATSTRNDDAFIELFKVLNESKTKIPGSDLEIHYEIL